MLLSQLTSGKRAAEDPLAAIPIGTTTSVILSGQQPLDHAVMLFGKRARKENPYIPLRVLRPSPDVCMIIDSTVGYCNITVAKMNKCVFNFAPHHLVGALDTDRASILRFEAFVEKSGWRRIARTELFQNTSRSISKKFKKIPEIGSVGEALGDTVTIQGLQFNRRGMICTRLVTIRGVLFPLCPPYCDQWTNRLTTSGLFCVVVPYTKDSVSFPGLSGSPVFWKEKVIGIFIANRRIGGDFHRGRIVLIIQPLVSPEMMPSLIFGKKKMQ